VGEDVAADDVVDDIDRTDRPFPTVLIDVNQLIGAKLEYRLSRAESTGTDDVGPGPGGELYSHRPNSAARAVDQHDLSGFEVAVIEQRLPRGEPGLRDLRAFGPMRKGQVAVGFDLSVWSDASDHTRRSVFRGSGQARRFSRPERRHHVNSAVASIAERRLGR
jgi:hypothetical protein